MGKILVAYLNNVHKQIFVRGCIGADFYTPLSIVNFIEETGSPSVSGNNINDAFSTYKHIHIHLHLHLHLHYDGASYLFTGRAIIESRRCHYVKWRSFGLSLWCFSLSKSRSSHRQKLKIPSGRRLPHTFPDYCRNIAAFCPHMPSAHPARRRRVRPPEMQNTSQHAFPHMGEFERKMWKPVLPLVYENGFSPEYGQWWFSRLTFEGLDRV